MESPTISPAAKAPCTEGIKYAGSKRAIIPHLLEVIRPLAVRTVLDGFSGTTRVSQALSRDGYTVVANDVAPWSRVFAQCYLLNDRPASFFQPWIDHLNRLPGRDGWFTRHYGGHANDGLSVQKDGRKRIWQRHNTRKLDTIREEIDRLTDDEIHRSVLLTSLILAMDRVDSTVGHQVSYLRRWSPRSYQTMTMVVPNFAAGSRRHQVHQQDVFELAPRVDADLAYFDPPYGSCNDKMPPSRVRYASYYHLWTTICRNDRPRLVGAANRRADASDRESVGVFEEFRRGRSGRFLVVEALEKLIEVTRARHLLLSYSNQGRMTLDEIVGLLGDLGLEFETLGIDHRSNVMRRMRWTREWVEDSRPAVREYLFLIRR